MSEVIVDMGQGTISFPPELAAAIVSVSAKVKRLGTDERNQHGGYGYVSVDKFYEIIGPLMADAGLFLMVNESNVDIREHAGKSGAPVSWLHSSYELQFVHKSGAVSCPVCRSLALPISGPQAFGAAQSYVEKQFLRQVFKIPTGEKDADEVAQDSMPSGRAQRPVAQGRTNGPATTLPPLPPRPAPSAPPHDPSTGEIGPHRITLPITTDGQIDYVSWGRLFIAAIKSAGNYAEWLAWQTENSGFLAECAERAPKASASIKAAIKKTSEQYGEVDETLTEADVEQVLNG